MGDAANFSFGLEDGKVLYDHMKVMGTFLDEVGFDVSPDGVRVLQADRTMVCVIDFLLKADALASLEGAGKFAVNSKALEDILKRLSGKPITVTRGKGKILISGGGRNFGVDEIAGWDWTAPPTDKLAYGCQRLVPGKWLDDAFQDADLAGEVVYIETKGNALIMTAKGQDLISYESELGLEPSGEPEDGRSLYPLEYLKKLKNVKGFEKVRIEVKTEYPLSILMEDDKVKFLFVLAPRVED